MKQTKSQQCISLKTVYVSPKIDAIRFSSVDIITTSGKGDENQGEWDPQEF